MILSGVIMRFFSYYLTQESLTSKKVKKVLKSDCIFCPIGNCLPQKDKLL